MLIVAPLQDTKVCCGASLEGHQAKNKYKKTPQNTTKKNKQPALCLPEKSFFFRYQRFTDDFAPRKNVQASRQPNKHKSR